MRTVADLEIESREALTDIRRRQGRLSRSNSFQFHAVFGKNVQNKRFALLPLGIGPSWEILYPPLGREKKHDMYTVVFGGIVCMTYFIGVKSKARS